VRLFVGFVRNPRLRELAATLARETRRARS